MEHKEIERFLKQEQQRYETFKKMVEDSLEEFCLNNSEGLDFFLFKTVLGREVCKLISSHIFDSALKAEKKYTVNVPRFIHNSASEAQRVSDMLTRQPFQDYLRNEFNIGISTDRTQHYLFITLTS